MANAMKYAVLCGSLIISSCAVMEKPPPTPVCLSDDVGWVCTDSTGDYRKNDKEIIGTTFGGYQERESFIGRILSENAKLRRKCQ